MNAAPNVSQVEAWNGLSGEHWVTEADRYDRMVGPFGERVIEMVAPRPGARVLDVGCGNGALALALSGLVGDSGSVVGLDISGPMLGEARRRASAARIGNATFERGDAQVHSLDSASFDAVVSRFGVMFFDDPVAAFTNIGRAVRPGGAMAFACWQELARNEWLIVPIAAALQYVPMPELGDPGAPGPFSFADPARVGQILADAGWVDVRLEEVVRLMWMGESVEDTVAFMKRTEMAETLMKGVDADTRDRAWNAVGAALEARSLSGTVELEGSAWIVTALLPG